MAHKLKHKTKPVEVVVSKDHLDFYLALGWEEVKEAKRGANSGRRKAPASSSK